MLRTLRLNPIAAAAIGTLALLFPWSDTGRLWAAASINNIALILFFVGVVVALKGLRTPGRRGIALHGVAVAFYVASLLLYEVTAGPMLVLVFVYALVAPWRLALRLWLIDLVALGATLAYSASITDKPLGTFGEQLRHVPELASGAAALFVTSALPIDAPRWIVPVLTAAVLAGVGGALLRGRPDPPVRDDLVRWLGVAAAGVIRSAPDT